MVTWALGPQESVNVVDDFLEDGGVQGCGDGWYMVLTIWIMF